MAKLIIFDIDGTLRDERNGIPQSIQKTLSICKQRGYELCICTGRNLSSIQEDVWNLNVNNLIANGGCFIKHKQTIVKQVYLNDVTLQKILNHLNCQTTGISLESDDELYMNQKAVALLQQANNQKGGNEQMIQYRDTFHLLPKQNSRIHKLCIWNTTSIDVAVFEQRYQLTLAQHFIWGSFLYYEFVVKNYDKGYAVQLLCSYLGIHYKDTIAFGDGLNDIAMFQACHTTIAMKDAPKQLKAIASSICESPNEDGVYKELKRRALL